MSEFYSVCTKCGHSDSSHVVLSRWCPRCNYMRCVRKVGEAEEQGRKRDAEPLTIEERMQGLQIMFHRTPAAEPGEGEAG